MDSGIKMTADEQGVSMPPPQEEEIVQLESATKHEPGPIETACTLNSDEKDAVHTAELLLELHLKAVSGSTLETIKILLQLAPSGLVSVMPDHRTPRNVIHVIKDNPTGWAGLIALERLWKKVSCIKDPHERVEQYAILLQELLALPPNGRMNSTEKSSLRKELPNTQGISRIRSVWIKNDPQEQEEEFLAIWQEWTAAMTTPPDSTDDTSKDR